LWIVVLLAVSASCGVAGEAGPEPPPQPLVRSRVTDATSISGRLLAHDGQPLTVARLRVEPTTAEPFEVEPDEGGGFALELPPGWARVYAAGVDHQEHELGLLAAGGSHQLELRLGTYPRPATLEQLHGFGIFELPEEGKGEQRELRVSFEFQAREDGTWRAELVPPEGAEGRALHYQLADATTLSRTINGTTADRFVFDGGGDFFSVIAGERVVEGQPLEIVFDPAALPPAGLPPRVELAEPESSFARLVALHAELATWEADAVASFAATMEAERGSEHGDFKAARAAFKAQLAHNFAAAADAEEDPVLRRLLFVAWAGQMDPTNASDAAHARARRILDELAPDDPLWSSRRAWALANVLELHDDPAYFAAAVEHPDPEVAAAVWVSRLIAADEAGDSERAREAMAALSTPRLVATRGHQLVAMYDPDRPMARGREVPDFRLRSLEGEAVHSRESLGGQTYLIDFWATWCSPCIDDMDALHEAYATLNAEAPQVEFLSVSLDHDPARVNVFRAERWPMPWLNAVPSEAEHHELSERFGLISIPTLVLVGPDRTILASSPRLDAENLVDIAREGS
jgi:thiol-disulfide isomerase/thioredoxin